MCPELFSDDRALIPIQYDQSINTYLASAVVGSTLSSLYSKDGQYVICLLDCTEYLHPSLIAKAERVEGVIRIPENSPHILGHNPSTMDGSSFIISLQAFRGVGLRPVGILVRGSGESDLSGLLRYWPG